MNLTSVGIDLTNLLVPFQRVLIANGVHLAQVGALQVVLQMVVTTTNQEIEVDNLAKKIMIVAQVKITVTRSEVKVLAWKKIAILARKV